MRALVKRNPFFPTFTRSFDNFLNDDFFKGFDEPLTAWNGSGPAVNIKEDENGFTLEFAAPGYEKGDFEVKVDKDLLTISSAKKTETETKEGEKFTRREFKYASFNRTFTLPETVDATKIGATYTNGILNVSIPKKEEAKPIPARTIEIG